MARLKTFCETYLVGDTLREPMVKERHPDFILSHDRL
jgi:hypothetical protein